MNKGLGFLLYIFYSILEEKIVQQSKEKCLDSMKDKQNFLSFIINSISTMMMRNIWQWYSWENKAFWLDAVINTT